MLKSDEEVYKEFGENLKKLRKEKNLTQTELANDLGMTQSAIYKYEKGLRKIPMSVLKQFANYFDLTLDELIDPNNELTENENPVKYKTHLSKYEVASEIGFTKEEINILESDTREIPAHFLEKIAKYFDVDISDLSGFKLSDESNFVFVSDNPLHTEYHKIWYDRFGRIEFTLEEFNEIANFVEFLLSKRKK